MQAYITLLLIDTHIHIDFLSFNLICFTSSYSNPFEYSARILSTVELFFIASVVGLSPLYCGHFWPILPAR
jgi:hypothetical protein